jgi:hypothetical protein
VKFSDDKIDVPMPRGPCYLTKGGNANGEYLTSENADTDGIMPMPMNECQ